MQKRAAEVSYAKIKKQAHALFEKAGFICRIASEHEYGSAIALMEELIEDYDYNLPLIEILSRSIERWEDQSKSFSAFNKRIREMDSGVSVLKLLMQQHDLGVADLPEIGSKSLVSKILNHQRQLTLNHIRALSLRFGVSPELFV